VYPSQRSFSNIAQAIWVTLTLFCGLDDAPCNDFADYVRLAGIFKAHTNSVIHRAQETSSLIVEDGSSVDER